jgi:Family of unknown function (DUF6193)
VDKIRGGAARRVIYLLLLFGDSGLTPQSYRFARASSLPMADRFVAAYGGHHRRPFREIASCSRRRGSEMTFADLLRASAIEQGLDLHGIIPDDDDPLKRATVPSTMDIRDPLEVGDGPWPGYFYFDGWGLGVQFLVGQETDIGELARIAYGWQTCVPVREIHSMARYSRLGALAEVAEQGTAEVIAAGWRYMRAIAAKTEWPQYQAMIEAAYVDPILRQYFPYTGMRRVSFLDGGLPFGRALVSIVPAPPGFNVSADDETHYAATPEETVAVAARTLYAMTLGTQGIDG